MFPVHMIIEAALGRKFVGKEVSKGGPSAVISHPCQRLHEIFRRCQDLKREITSTTSAATTTTASTTRNHLFAYCLSRFISSPASDYFLSVLIAVNMLLVK